MAKIVYLITCIVLFNTTVLSQENTIPTDSLENNEYKLREINKLNVRSDISSTITGFNFYDKTTKKSVHLIPNERLKNKITLSYRKINLGFSFSPNGKPFNDDDNLKGPSKTFSVNLGFIVNKYAANVFYNKTNGYYVFNTEDYREELNAINNTDTFIKTPQVSSLVIGLENSYYFNGDKYSIKFAKNQSEVQLKSAGSAVAYFQLLYSELDGREEQFSILPTFAEQGTNFRHLNRNYYALFGYGYGYNWVMTKHIYITGLFYPAIGGRYSILKNENEAILDKKTDLTVAAIGEISGGYHYNNLYGGAYLKFGAFNVPLADNQLASGNLLVMGYLGYRFNAPKFLERFFDKVEDKLKKK